MTGWQGIGLAVLVALISSPGWWQFAKSLLNRDNLDAKTTAEITKAANSLIEPLNASITSLKAAMALQNIEIADLKLELAHSLKREGEYLLGISQLTEQVIRRGDDPVWRPAVRKPITGPLGKQ